jgi:membrane protein YqaA with SNARE-associated domain
LHEQLEQVVATYGYWAIAFIVGLESMGIPLPGETILVVAAIYAAADPALNIWFVIAGATLGSIVGDNAGYWIGKHYAYGLLVRYGKHVGISVLRVKVGQYLFRRHGGKVVFFGRFVALLRILAAFLAGVNHMPWRAFLIANGRLVGECLRDRRVPVRQALASPSPRGRNPGLHCWTRGLFSHRLSHQPVRIPPSRSCRTRASGAACPRCWR